MDLFNLVTEFDSCPVETGGSTILRYHYKRGTSARGPEQECDEGLDAIDLPITKSGP